MTNYFKSKNVLVAGGAGFVGNNLIKRLVSLGANVTATLYKKPPAIENEKIEYLHYDLRDPEDCRRVCDNTDYLFMNQSTKTQTEKSIEKIKKMNEMLSFLSENCGNIPGIHTAHNPCKYNYKIKLPKILKVSSQDIAKRGGSYGVALYIMPGEQILIPDNFDQYNSHALGLLMHELYHHVQYLNGEFKRTKCRIDTEIPAYKVQIYFQQKFLKKGPLRGLRQCIPPFHLQIDPHGVRGGLPNLIGSHL